MSRLFQLVSLTGLSLAGAILLNACGGDAGGGVNTTSSNVALASAGATITSNYLGNESYVIDGDTSSATGGWTASTSGDWLKIDFSQAYTIDSIAIMATNLTATTEFSMEISTDDTTYITLNNTTACVSPSISSAGYGCDLKTTYSARYFRFTVLDNTKAPQINEIQVLGQ